jgi:thermitase
MTTDGTPDNSDRRDEDQRANDRRAAAAQSAALTRSNTDQRARAEGRIDRLRERRAGLSSLQSDAPFPIEVLRHRGRRHHEDERHDLILIARGELLLRVPADAASTPQHADADRPGGDAPSYQQAALLLEKLGYRSPPQHVFPKGALPLQKFFTEDRNAEQLVQDRDQVRHETGAEVDLNYVCTTGYLSKGEDYPVATAGLPWSTPATGLPAVTVAVIDTGINHVPRNDGWLASIPEDAQNEDLLDVFSGNGSLDESGGHGTFVSGIVQQIAPGCTIKVYRAMESDGLGPIDKVGSAITQAASDGANIINLSLGTETVDDQPPMPFVLALQTLQADYPGVVVVASAGNNGDAVPLFPADMDGVVAVGALEPNGHTPAPWSSKGDWVRCSTVGVGITSTFVEGFEQHDDGTPGQQFGPDAWAVWSGTSFSAAQVTGKLAQLCQQDGIDPAAALSQLLPDPWPHPYGHRITILPGS